MSVTIECSCDSMLKAPKPGKVSAAPASASSAPRTISAYAFNSRDDTGLFRGLSS